MPNNVPYRVYVIATKRKDKELPNEAKICLSQFYLDISDARFALKAFPSEIRKYFGIFLANIEIVSEKTMYD